MSITPDLMGSSPHALVDQTPFSPFFEAHFFSILMHWPLIIKAFGNSPKFPDYSLWRGHLLQTGRLSRAACAQQFGVKIGSRFVIGLLHSYVGPEKRDTANHKAAGYLAKHVPEEFELLVWGAE